MKKVKSLLSVLLIAIIVITMFTGCEAREKDRSDDSSGKTTQSAASRKPSSDDKGKVASLIPYMITEVAEKKAINPDTVGWMQIPQLNIDDVVVCNTESNDYYRRRDFNKQDHYNGVLYADKRSTFGDGTVDQLGVNTCIYGHSMTDNKKNAKYNIFFGPLHDLRDPEIAKTIPYMFFSTEKENLAFEIFAVFIANTDNIEIPYNRNDIDPKEFREMVKTQVLPRSIYNYDVDLKDDDKFMTLSTCIYVLPNGSPTNYPNTYYRYAIMGRLVDPGEALKTEASFTINQNPVLDPDGKISSK